MKTYAALLSVVILLCPTSAFAERSVANFGFYGIDPQLQRAVACIDTPAWPASECMATAAKSIYAINNALGWEHYVFIGSITPAGAQQSYDNGTFLISGVPTNHQWLAVTIPHFTPEGEIVKAMVMLTPASIHGEFATDSVLTHELIHAMGADHAPCGGAWASIMAPAENCPAKADHISAGDKATLRRAYPNPSWWRS